MHRRLIRLTALGVALVAALALAGIASAGQNVYTLSNSPAGNAVLAYSHPSSGVLSPLGLGSYPTGGLGTGANLGSQGALVLSKNGKRLYAVNAGDNTVSMFAVNPDGTLVWKAIAPSGGTMPISLTVDDQTLYVLNAGDTPNITGFSITGQSLYPIAGSTRSLGLGDAGPAEVAFSPNGRSLVVTDKTSSTIDTYLVGAGDLTTGPFVSASAGGTPFGFAFDTKNDLLVSEAAGSASSYSIGASGALTTITGAALTHQAAPCWLVTTPDGHYAYTANAGAGTISGFSIGSKGALTLLDPSGATATIGAGSHPLDEAVSGDGTILFDLVDGFHQLQAFRISSNGGLLADATTAGFPVGALGLAAS